MKVQEAIDKINQLKNWIATCDQKDDRYYLHISHKDIVSQDIVFSLAVQDEHPEVVIYRGISRTLTTDSDFDDLYVVMTALRNIKNTFPKNRGIPETKHKIHVIPGDNGYLNVNFNLGSYIVGTAEPPRVDNWQTEFTESDIDRLKQQADVAVDWSKAKLEPADDDEQD